MKRSKKITSIFLSVIIIVTSCGIGLFAKAQEKEININISLLEAILNEQNWIIETLVEGDTTNNPYAVINTAATNELIFNEVLENYQNDAAFRSLVNAMDIYSNGGDYLSGITDDVLSVLTGIFSSLDGLKKFVSSTDELKYESILNDLLKADYTSSWGDTLYEDNMDLENLKQQAKLCKKLGKYKSALSDTLKINNSGGQSAIMIYDPYTVDVAEYEITIQDYVDHFLDAYEQDLEEYLLDIPAMRSIEGNEALKKKILALSALGLTATYECVSLPEIGVDLDDLFYDGFLEETLDVVKGSGKAFKIAEKSFDCAIYLEAIQHQKNSTYNSMLRIANNTSDADLKNVVKNYADLLSSACDAQTLGYEVVANYIRNQSTVTNIVKEHVEKTGPKIIKNFAAKHAGAKTLILANSISSAIKVADLAVWVADKTTGIKETSKKIFICKYVDKLINQVISTYQEDLKIYFANRTDENAENVLADLQFLKELRLYGEECAYDSMCEQMDSAIGILLGGGNTREYIDRRFQASVDTFLGCSLSPIKNKQFVMQKGDLLQISSEDVNGKIYAQAMYKKAGKQPIYFAEPDLRLLGGIKLNGAKIDIFNAPKGFYLPLIENDGDSGEINVYCDDTAFGTISNSGVLDISFHNSTSNLLITDSIDNSGTMNINSENENAYVDVYSVKNSKQIDIIGAALNIKGSPTNNGIISGTVKMCSDNSQVYENGYYKIGVPVMLGNGQYSDLIFENNAKEGLKILGTQTVTNYISNNSTRLRTSENIVLTGNCVVNNNEFNSSLSFKNYYTSQPLKIKGTGIIYGDVSFGGNTSFGDGLNLSSECKTLTLNGETNVKGDFIYGSGVIAGDNWLKLHNDAVIEASSPSISNLDFVGRMAQLIKSSNDLTVNNLQNHNSSLGGVSFESKIFVTNSLLSDSLASYKNGKNIVLTDSARLNGNQIRGSLSAQNWTCADSANVKGTLYTSGNISIADNTTLDVIGYNQSSGNLTIGENSALNCVGDYYNAGTTTNNGTLAIKGGLYTGAVTNNGTIAVDGDNQLTGAFAGGTFITKGDLTASAEFKPDALSFTGKISQKFNNSSKTEAKYLTIDNSSSSGFTVGSVINVTELFNDRSKKLINGENIVLTSNANYFTNGTTKGDLTISGNFTVPAGETMTVNGKLNVKSGATLTVEENAKFIVKRNMTASSSTINVNEGGLLQINDYLDSSSAQYFVDGDLLIKGDAAINSGEVNANGLITFKGDLSTSSGTWNNPNVTFACGLPQSVSGSSINVNNLNINNTSRNGITFKSNVNYYGEYNPNNSLLNGEKYIISKQGEEK